ncbi:MAG: PDZ domain-containing protein [Actinobacteria bacterium]|nr:PDZ domain-containing protein [Actinomycetota bacterium]
MVTPRRRERVWPWAVGLLAVILVALAFIVPVPRYLEGPGSTRNTVDLVTVRGHESFDSDGAILYLTVSQRRATVASLIGAALSANVEVRTPEEVSPSGDRRQDRQLEQAQMDRSKLTALIVAFDVLGLPLTVTGEGAFVQYVEPDSPAAAVIEAGDVIVGVEGVGVTTSSELRDKLAGKAPGEVVTVTRTRGETTEDIAVELIPAEDDATRGILGVVIQTYNESVDTGFSVELDSGKVIGPSAGLAWTLGIIDRLTPGELSGGRTVAVTGTIDSSGEVGAVGGVDKKVLAAIRDGATLFLYPASTSDESLQKMRAAAGDKIEMHPVSTVYEALDYLDTSGIEGIDSQK